MLAPPELKEVHPLGKSPVIGVKSEHMTKPLILAESGAIVEYLSGYFAKHLIPERYQAGKTDEIGGETESWLRYRFYMHYAEGSLMTLMIVALLMDSKSSYQYQLGAADSTHLQTSRTHPSHSSSSPSPAASQAESSHPSWTPTSTRTGSFWRDSSPPRQTAASISAARI